jgi:hypothetical protein
MNEIKDIRENFLYCINLKKIRLRNLPNFVFLCGGTTERLKSTTQEGNPELYQSMRKAINDVCINSHPNLAKKIILAESYQDWAVHGTVRSLIDFELAIADMASAIVLILEAPGAYAELGSFSVLDRLAEKLILIVNEKMIAGDSYISLGPIKYLEETERVVKRFNWDSEYIVDTRNRGSLKTLLNGSVDDVLRKATGIASVIDELSQNMSHTNPSIDMSRDGHICFIIGDLIYNFGSLKLREIVDYLRDYFCIKKSSDSFVKSCLYILESFDFVKKVVNGDTFYVPTDKNEGFLKYSYSESIFEETDCKNISEVRGKVIAYYSKADTLRFEVIFELGKASWH